MRLIAVFNSSDKECPVCDRSSLLFQVPLKHINARKILNRCRVIMAPDFRMEMYLNFDTDAHKSRHGLNWCTEFGTETPKNFVFLSNLSVFYFSRTIERWLALPRFPSYPLETSIKRSRRGIDR